jgi:hypothetical protein
VPDTRDLSVRISASIAATALHIMSARLLIVALLASPLALNALKVEERMSSRENPMRKVVTMLEMMTKKIEAEGKKEEKLFEEFMCYCKGGKAELAGAIQAGKDKIVELDSSITETSAEHKQLIADVA